MKIKGVRDIATRQSYNRCSMPQDRKQIVTELARLEQTRARFKKECTMWQENLHRAEKRLQEVEQRMSSLQQSLDTFVAVEKRNDQNVFCQAGERASKQAEVDAWQELTIEY